jgi:mono/diheme cytochrome c family protein
MIAVLALAAAGCSSAEGYPEHLVYPVRADLLVEQTTNDPAEEPGPLGQLDQEIARAVSRGGRAYDPAQWPSGQKEQLQKFLTDTFGTPAHPTVAGEAEVAALAGQLDLQTDRLAEGSRLFRRHCQQCHGLAGDGRGPTGPWIYPHPRDFRQGLFKFVSTTGGDARKPCRDDLVRTLREGLPGTAMPSFGLLPEEDLKRLAGYVTFLSLRGQVEYSVGKALLAEGGPDLDGDVATESRAALRRFLRDWARAETDRLAPHDPAQAEGDPAGAAVQESVRRGYQLFTDAGKANCVSCHADFGRQAQYRYDAWGTVVRPANLTAGTYKGGKRPIDLYGRVRGGIGPSRMPAAPLSEEQLWDVVRFVEALPYPARLPPEVRARVYGTKEQVAGR